MLSLSSPRRSDPNCNPDSRKKSSLGLVVTFACCGQVMCRGEGGEGRVPTSLCYMRQNGRQGGIAWDTLQLRIQTGASLLRTACKQCGFNKLFVPERLCPTGFKTIPAALLKTQLARVSTSLPKRVHDASTVLRHAS
eukprot:352803-Chlamydomonas_euryale.AAC.8